MPLPISSAKAADQITENAPRTYTNIRAYQSIWPNIDESAYVDVDAVVIGKVTLGKEVSVWPTAVIRGDVNTISIGEGSNVQDGSVLHVSHIGPYRDSGGELSVGRFVTVGHKVILHACEISDYCLIGMGATIMDDVEIGEYTIVGAGSLVTPGKKLDPRSLYAGSPARKVRELSDEEMASLEHSAKHYIKIMKHYRDEMTEVAGE